MFHLSLDYFFKGKPTERHLDSNQQDYPGLLSVCVQGSVHLNAPSLFFFTSPTSVMYDSFHQCHKITFVSLLICFYSFSHTNLNSTLLAPYYHISEKSGCMIRINEGRYYNLNYQHMHLLVVLLDVQHQINGPLQLTVSLTPSSGGDCLITVWEPNTGSATLSSF